MAHLSEIFQDIVGKANVLTKEMDTAYYRSGFRYGFGEAAAVVFPNTLVQQWQVLQAAVDAQCAIIMQATKTGLTGGSSPSGFDYDRPVVIINTSRLRGLKLLKHGTQALAFPGTTLFELSQELKKINRVPHSVLGSTTIGATVIGGVANNAGGALCKRGSSYTEFALYARVNQQGSLELVDHLGIQHLGDTPEEILQRLESGDFTEDDLIDDARAASDTDYVNRIRDLEATVPNRYNADPKRLFEASGSAGKVACFAVRVDTFAAPKKKQVFMLGTNDPAHLVTLRRHILSSFEHLPEMCEYLNRNTFTVAQKYGKDVALAIKHLGTDRLPKAYALKAKAEHLLHKIPFLPRYLPDIFLYYASKFFPQHLPKRLLKHNNDYEHMLILVTADEAIEESRRYLQDEWSRIDGVGFFECSEQEQEAALLHRFSAAGAGIRYQNVHQGSTEEVLALDIALLSNDQSWAEALPEELTQNMVLELSYGHYLCHVFHHVYIYRKGTDLEHMKRLLLERLEARGAKFPAEHNVGHLYEAEQVVKDFHQQLDPTNTFNPGIGKTSKSRR
ncbi:MAG: D-lactate dehydrogenase [Phycisphaerales bacterium]|nr:D-lactate dehydrogenase [Phycisphaerales bacterium]